jgi:hypothetical protein
MSDISLANGAPHVPNPPEGPALSSGHGTPASTTRVFGILLLITLAGAAVRLAIPGKISLWYDEANTLLFSNYAYDLLKLFNSDYNTDPPLFVLLTRLWHDILVLLPWKPGTYAYDYLLRLLPAVFSILTVPATFWAGRSLFRYAPLQDGSENASGGISIEDKTSLFAAFLVAISPFQVFYAHELRCYSLFGLLGVVSLVFFTNALHDNKHTSWMLLTACLALSFWNHFLAAWFFICIDVYLLLTFPYSKQYYLKWGFWHLVAGLACLPVLYLAWQTTEIINNIIYSWIPAPDIKTPFITFKAFFAGYSPRAWAYWLVFLICSGFCGLGALHLRRHGRPLLLLILWTCLAVAVCAFLWRIRSFSYYEIRLFIGSAISASLLAGLGWAKLPRIARIAAAVVVTALTVPLLADVYAQRIHPVPQHRLGVRHKAENRAATQALARLSSPGEPVFHASHITLSPFRIYLAAHPQKHICLSPEAVDGFIGAYPNQPLWESLDMIPVPVTDLNLNVPSFWLVLSWWEPFEPPQDIINLEHWFQERFTEVDRQSFFAVTLLRFKQQNSVLPPDTVVKDEGSTGIF